MFERTIFLTAKTDGFNFWVSSGKIKPFFGVYCNFLHTRKQIPNFFGGSGFLMFYLFQSIKTSPCKIQNILENFDSLSTSIEHRRGNENSC